MQYNPSLMYGGMALLLIVLVFSFLVYFVPTFIAFSRGHPNRGWILLLNFFVGWTLFGWVGALVWSLVTPGSANDPFSAPGDTKLCPRCAERVKRAAFACRFCGYEFPPSPPPPPIR